MKCPFAQGLQHSVHCTLGVEIVYISYMLCFLDYFYMIVKNYSFRSKLLDTFNKSLCPKLDALFLSYSNLDFFWKSNHMDGKKHCQLA
jgi:hypothetical protein